MIGGNMQEHRLIHIWASFKALFVNIFASKYTLILLDSVMTVIISIHTSCIDMESKEWMNKLFLYVGISILINMICVWAEHIQKKQITFFEYCYGVCSIQNKINSNTSTKLYRVNKKVTLSIRKKEITRGEINSIADFQTLSFDVCNELYSFITDYCNCKECEVTIFQRFIDEQNSDFVTMIAYRNTQNRQPASYGQKYYLNSKKKNVPVFIRIFRDANAEICILHNKKTINNNFDFFNDSLAREKRICQYIGIPIRTNRNKVEILLQIDVSQNRVFGMQYKTVKKFAENIFIPFANLLYCSYERDLVLNKFYDVLEENISNIRGNK